LAPSSAAYGIPALIRSGGGAVINMASNLALMGITGRDCYTAAKGGIAALTRSLAVEFAPQRVRVNAIAPSATMTERVAVQCGRPCEPSPGLQRTYKIPILDAASGYVTTAASAPMFMVKPPAL
jgi:NAD(P)-dependent dehydrogenase (short-subunit alcohol dehydrogenase family)